MKTSTRILTVASLAFIVAAASAQTTPDTPPTIKWDPAEVAVIYAADQETFFDVFKDSKGNPANAWTQPTWGQSCVISDDECGDGAAVRIDNLDFLPLQFQATVDLSEYRFFHMDIWAQNDDQICIKFQNFWPGETFVTEVYNIKGGEWTRLDIDLDREDFTWSKKNEVPQHCINVLQIAGEKIPNDYPHSPAIYMTNIMAHNDASVLGGSGIDSITTDKDAADGALYNIFGQRVGKDYKGLVITKGRKFIQK